MTATASKPRKKLAETQDAEERAWATVGDVIIGRYNCGGGRQGWWYRLKRVTNCKKTGGENDSVTPQRFHPTLASLLRAAAKESVDNSAVKTMEAYATRLEASVARLSAAVNTTIAEAQKGKSK